ncbi:EAL domain-containing protein [Nocardioides carbamazepini]|uniref:sensor domain-containing protein n=1 Tax=Nocardioides carbamazepini TaxID=2854259 RepID=UPI00214A11B1|nr:EAL domain-containing protein [Nocardioides carbamazepini]MCR1783285.1 EAL domain-containing protein [Nocardioides carbamazepini]
MTDPGADRSALERTVVDSIPFSILATDAAGRIRIANPAAAALVGREQGELIGRSLADIDGAERQRHLDGAPVLAHAARGEAEWAYRRKDGTTVPVHETIVPLEPEDGAPGGFLVVAFDITHRIEDRRRIEHVASHDSLTNLPNRSMLVGTNDRLALSSALRQALDQDELSVVYQPQVDLGTGEVVGVEALARWASPSLGAVPPDRFIPVAEDGGMIAELGAWVLTTACAALAGVQEQLGRPLRLAVNVSPRQLRGQAWLEEIAAAIEEAGIEPSQLEVEITEGLLIEDHGDVVAMLQSLRSLGVSIAVDDFGRGYSSLAYLTRFPIDKIKIDRSFVREIDCAEKAAIVDAIIVMGHALGMRVVAEGVETAEQERYLRRRGCDEVQGYLYSPGVPAASLEMVARALSRQ